MPIRSPLLAFLAILALAGAGLYLHDATREDVVAEGVAVNGIGLGGLTPEEARSKLERRLVGPMRRPVVVEAGGRRFALGADRARVAVNVDAMVNQALGSGREGNLLARAWRALTGEEAQADLRSAVTFSEPAVDGLVAHVEDEVTRPAQDAAVVPTPTGLTTTPERSGQALDTRRLRRDVEAELIRPSPGRRVRAKVRRVAPRVGVGDLAGAHPTYLTVSKEETKLRLWRNLELEKTYDVAVGMPRWPTPNGLFSIQSKEVDPAWSVPNEPWAGELAGQVIPGGDPDNPLEARWMGFSGGAGIHGTSEVDSLGTAASHGCIRMIVADVVDLYDRIEVGTPIFVG